MKQVNQSDRRVIRTRAELIQALHALIMEKPYERITVQDILERANIGRTTFYTHYLDKDDLLLSAIPDDILSFDSESDSLIPLLTPIFVHAQENYAQFRALMGSEGITIVHKIGHQKTVQNWLNHIERIRERGIQLPLPSTVVAQYLTGAFMALLKWWIDEKMPYSPDEMDAMFRQLTIAGLTEIGI
jgi:hypothetical protein